jgi:hypothetical protein
MDRQTVLPTSPPPPRVGSSGYYKEKIQELIEWLASEESKATGEEKRAWENGETTVEMLRAGKASMAFRARHWIRENIIGMK